MTTPALTYPGVYVQEVSSGVRPVEAASTSTAAFVGVTEMGPDTGAQLVTSWVEFLRRFGSFTPDGFLAQSAFQFFNNGGRLCYIVRVTRGDAVAASTTIANRANPAVAAGLTLRANSTGAWGNALVAEIGDGTADPDNTFRIRIGRQADATVVPAAFSDVELVEDHDNLGMDPDGANYVVDVLARDSQLVEAVVPTANTSVERGFLRGGVQPALPLEGNRSFRIDLDGDGLQDVQLAPEAGEAAATPAKVAEEIQKAVRALAPRHATTSIDAFRNFTCAVEGTGAGTRLVLTSGTSGLRSSVRVRPAGAGDASAKLGIGAAARSVTGGAVRRPVAVPVVPIGDATPAAPLSDVKLGSDGEAPLTTSSYVAAFARLNTVTDASLLAVPGEGSPALLDAGLGYCAGRPLQDMFFIGEMGEHVDERDEAKEFRDALAVTNNYGAVYFPWLLVPDPTGRSRTPVALPPSGFVAGLYARTDATRGVWKAPAGIAASINGAVGLTAELDDTNHGELNKIDVNVIRRLPGTGIVAFGARTVHSDPLWRYVPVRRTAIMLRVSIYQGIQFAVFEPNDEPLWSQLRLSIGSFLNTLFRQGAFQGATPAQAYFVKCDDETTTQADIDRGVVNVLVGFAPLKPAEFVVVRLSQQAGQAAG